MLSVGGGTATVTPETTPTLSASSEQVTELLDEVAAQVAEAEAVPVASRAPILARAATTLARAESQAAALPVTQERVAADSSAAHLHDRIEQSRRGESATPAPGTADSAPAPQPTAAPSPLSPEPTTPAPRQSSGSGSDGSSYGEPDRPRDDGRRGDRDGGAPPPPG